MSNYKKKEVMAYLTRKPVTSEDIKIAQERLIQQQPFYQQTPELVQDDIARPQTGSIPLYQNVQPGVAIQETLPTYAPPDMSPTMPSAKDVPNPQFNILELADGGRAGFAEGDIVKANQLVNILKNNNIKTDFRNIARSANLYGIKKADKYGHYVEPSKEEFKRIKKEYDLNLLKQGQSEPAQKLFKEKIEKASELLKQGKTQAEVQRILSKEYKINPNQSTSGFIRIAADKLEKEGFKVKSGREAEQGLSKKIQDTLKEYYPNINFEFDKYKYGISTDNPKFSSVKNAAGGFQEYLKERGKNIQEVSKLSVESKMNEAKKILSRQLGFIEEGKTTLDLAHRSSLKQNKELGLNYLSSNLGIDPKDINRRIIKPVEDELKTLYKQQTKLVDQAKKFESVPKEIQEKLSDVNFKISEVIATTDGRLQGIHVDEKTLKPKITGIDYSKSVDLGVFDKPVKDLSKQEIGFINKFLLPEAMKAQSNIENIPSLATRTGNKLYFDPTGVGTFLETSAGQMLSKSAPNLLKAASRLSTATGTPINALLGVALNADEFKGKGLSDLETIAAGAYKGSTQDLLNFGDLIIRKLPVAIYEKFVEDKPFLESLLNKPEYFEFADKQIDKYASEKSIQDRIQNRAEYEVRKSLPINVSDTEVPNTITSEEFKNLVETKKGEILNSNPDLKNLYEQEQTIPTPKEKTTSQNLMLGPIVFPKYTQEELNLAYGGKVKYANGTKQDDLYIPPLNKPDTTIREGVLSLATGGRVNFAGGSKYALPLEALRKIDKVLLELKNNLFHSSMKEKTGGKEEAIRWTTENWMGSKKSPKDDIFKQVEDLKQSLPKEYHSTLEDIKNLTDKTEYTKAKQTIDALDNVLNPELKFENLPKDMFPMTDPLNDAFIITDPKSGIMESRYVVSMSIDPETGRGIRQTFDRWDPENKVIIKDRTQWKLQGVESLEKGKEGLN